MGYASVGLSQRYADTDWTVIVTGDLEEVLAPIETINTRALLSGFLAILIIGALAVYFTTHRPQKLDTMDELHELER